MRSALSVDGVNPFCAGDNVHRARLKNKKVLKSSQNVDSTSSNSFYLTIDSLVHVSLSPSIREHSTHCETIDTLFMFVYVLFFFIYFVSCFHQEPLLDSHENG